MHVYQVFRRRRVLHETSPSCFPRTAAEEPFAKYLDELDLALWKYIPDAEVLGDKIKLNADGDGGQVSVAMLGFEVHDDDDTVQPST